MAREIDPFSMSENPNPTQKQTVAPDTARELFPYRDTSATPAGDFRPSGTPMYPEAPKPITYDGGLEAAAEAVEVPKESATEPALSEGAVTPEAPAPDPEPPATPTEPQTPPETPASTPPPAPQPAPAPVVPPSPKGTLVEPKAPSANPASKDAKPE